MSFILLFHLRLYSKPFLMSLKFFQSSLLGLPSVPLYKCIRTIFLWLFRTFSSFHLYKEYCEKYFCRKNLFTFPITSLEGISEIKLLHPKVWILVKVLMHVANCSSERLIQCVLLPAEREFPSQCSVASIRHNLFKYCWFDGLHIFVSLIVKYAVLF